MQNPETPIRVAVIEDELGPREAIIGQIRHLFADQLHLPEGAVGVDVDSGIKVIREYQPELVFLDIQLGASTAFALLEKLRSEGPLDFFVLITTAYSDLGKDIINAAPTRNIGYLSKPIDPYELEERIQWFQENRALLVGEQAPPTHLITTRKGTLKIPFPDLVRFQSFPNAGRRVFFYVQRFEPGQGAVLRYESAEEPRTLNELMESLSTRFFMANQQEIINMDHIERVEFRQKIEVERQDGVQTITVDRIVMDSGDVVNLARERKESFLKRYQG